MTKGIVRFFRPQRLSAGLLLSLVTCYPFDATDPGGPMRYVVTARKAL